MAYDNRTRRMRAEMRRIKENTAYVAELERREELRLLKVERAESRVAPGVEVGIFGGIPLKERRRLEREAKLPEDRICPSCREYKPKSRQWVITDKNVWCISCDRWLTSGKEAKE